MRNLILIVCIVYLYCVPILGQTQTENDSTTTEMNWEEKFISKGQFDIGAGNLFSFNKNIFNTEQKIDSEPLFIFNALVLYDFTDLFSLGINIIGSLQNIENHRLITEDGYKEKQLTFYTLQFGGRAQWYYPKEFVQP